MQKPLATPAANKGLLLGLTGVVIFGLTLPATRLALEGLSPEFVVSGRAALAGILAAIVLAATRTALPARGDWPALARVSLGVVLGFPLLATFAMQHAPAAHGGVVLGVLPLATAVASAIVVGERPSLAFWATAVAGSLAVVAYALTSSNGSAGLHWADILLAGAVISAAWGYAESGLLARRLGGWQVISWALVIALPAMGLAAILTPPGGVALVPASAWLGFLYVAVMSQFVGFFARNKGLAMGGVARVGQLQLLQTFVTLAASALLLGEAVSWLEVGFALAVTALVALGWRMRISTPAMPSPSKTSDGASN